MYSGHTLVSGCSIYLYICLCTVAIRCSRHRGHTTSHLSAFWIRVILWEAVISCCRHCTLSRVLVPRLASTYWTFSFCLAFLTVCSCCARRSNFCCSKLFATLFLFCTPSSLSEVTFFKYMVRFAFEVLIGMLICRLLGCRLLGFTLPVCRCGESYPQFHL